MMALFEALLKQLKAIILVVFKDIRLWIKTLKS